MRCNDTHLNKSSLYRLGERGACPAGSRARPGTPFCFRNVLWVRQLPLLWQRLTICLQHITQTFLLLYRWCNILLLISWFPGPCFQSRYHHSSYMSLSLACWKGINALYPFCNLGISLFPCIRITTDTIILSHFVAFRVAWPPLNINS